MIKVLVFGTFDGLHEGHLDFFRQALRSAQGKLDEEVHLVVVVGRDSTVQRVKNKLPKFNEQERLKAVQNAQYVDEARLGNATAVGGVPSEGGKGFDPYKVIEEIKPDIICLGYDQTHFTEKLEQKIKEMGLKIEIIRLKPYKPEMYKSSIINRK